MSDTASQSQDTQETQIQQDAETEALYSSYDIKRPTESKNIELPTVPDPNDPAIGQEEETQTAKTIKVKYNKEEVEIPEDQIADYVQKGLALDKERERKTEYEKTLDRAAKLQGFKDHTELAANLDRLEQEREQAKAREFEEMEQGLYEEMVEAGLDPDKARTYIENHPAMKEAKALRDQQQQQTYRQELASKWQALYDKYPHLVEESGALDRGEVPSFFTPEMKARVDRGYDPLDAYQLAHGTELQSQTKKQTEQSIIKQMQLGTRGFAEQGTPEPEESDLLPAQLALAEMYGLKPENVRKQQKLIQSRR